VSVFLQASTVHSLLSFSEQQSLPAVLYSQNESIWTVHKTVVVEVRLSVCCKNPKVLLEQTTGKGIYFL
jgi:hypothetical protein